MRLAPNSCAPGLALFCAAQVLAGTANAQEREVVLVPIQDTSIFSGTSDSDGLGDGSGESLWLSVTAGGLNRRLLLKFDLAAIPRGSTVRAVTLSLYESRARDAHAVTVHRLLQSWGEGASNGGTAGAGAPAQPGDATWISRFHPHSAWSTPGGLFHAEASASTVVGSPNQRYTWSAQVDASGSAAPLLVQDVQAWVDAPTTNHGWVLVGKEDGTQNAKRFSSRTSAEPPRLSVRYREAEPNAQDGDVPLPPWALVTLAGLLAAGLARSRRAAAPPES
jgi:hypothetical protein